MNRDDRIYIPPRGTRRGEHDRAFTMLGMVVLAVSAAGVICAVIWFFGGFR